MKVEPILALDASGPICSVALKVGEKIFSELVESVRSHSENLLPMVDKVLKAANITLNDLDVCVYGKGPGSFTGLRLVTAIVQGFAYKKNLNVVGFSTLKALALCLYQENQAEDIIICEDARMNEVYFGHYQLKNHKIISVAEERCVKPEGVIEQFSKTDKPPLLFGSGVSVYETFEGYPNKSTFQAKALANALLDLLKQTDNPEFISHPESILPSYIRQPKYSKGSSK